MLNEKALKTAACAAFALVAGVACGAQTETFESGTWTSGGTPSGLSGTWGGDGYIVASNITSVTGGFIDSTVAHTKVLSVEGTVVCTNDSGSAEAQAQIDFLVNVPDASDELDSLDSDVQIAVAAGTNVTAAAVGTVPLMIYCKPKTDDAGTVAGSASWIPGPEMTTGAWHRVSLLFDYSSGFCKVSLDGSPCVTTNGFVTTNAASQTSVKGAWYKLANNPAQKNYVKDLTFVGVAAIDDVVIGQETAVTETTYTGTATIEGISVDNTDLVKWGVTADTAASVTLDDSGLTVAQKVVAGLDPTDGSKFEATGMTMTSAAIATIALPAGIDTTGRTYTVQYSTDDGVTKTSATTVNNGDGTLTVSGLPSEGAVLKIYISVSASGN